MNWRRYFERRKRDEDLAHELEFYLAHETDANMELGLSPREAGAAARRKLGNATLLREKTYEMNTIAFLDSLMRDLRFGLRMLRLNAGYSAVAILSLALGIGANTAIFRLLDAVQMRTLPVERPEELAEIVYEGRASRSGHFSGRRPMFTSAQWQQIRTHQQAFQGLAAWSLMPVDLAEGGEARRAYSLWVNGDFFNVLGVKPLLGRLFSEADDTPGCAASGAVLSHGFWQREFAGRTDVLGRTVTLNRVPVPIVGVAEQSFFGTEVGRSFDIALPICSEPVIRGENSGSKRANFWWLAVAGRLSRGWTVEKATAHLNAVSPSWFAATVPPMYRPQEANLYRSLKLRAQSFAQGVSSLRREYQQPLNLLLAISGLVLLIACANIANLMLARATVREREFAIRLSIGASRWRLVRQLLAESTVIAAAGMLLGALIGGILSRALIAFMTGSLRNLYVDLTADWRVAGFVAALGVATCLLFGLIPAFRATTNDPAEALKSGGRGVSGSRERLGLRRGLVVSQVGLSLVLLAGAFLFVRSLTNLMTLDAGFQKDGILVAQVTLRGLNNDQAPALRNQIEARLANLPGVAAVASASVVPLSGSVWNEFVAPGTELVEENEQNLSNFTAVTPSYFKTLGLRLLTGRPIESRDRAGSGLVAVISETFAKRIFAGEKEVIGKTFRIPGRPAETARQFEVVGLVKDSKYYELREDSVPVAFVALAQNETGLPSFVLRGEGTSVAALIDGVKTVLREVNPNLLVEFSTMRSQIDQSLLRERLMAHLSTFFAILAGTLALIGLYGVLSYAVARRRNEFGIRMALGADRGRIVRIVLFEAGLLVACGLALGLAGTLFAARTAQGLLFGLTPNDPLTILGAAASLSLVALAAAYFPAARAGRIPPAEALRNGE